MEDREHFHIHPDLPELLRDWTREVLRYQPDNIIDFSRDYFTALYNTGAVLSSNLHHLKGRNPHVGVYSSPDDLTDATFQSADEPQYLAARADREAALTGQAATISSATSAGSSSRPLSHHSSRISSAHSSKHPEAVSTSSPSHKTTTPALASPTVNRHNVEAKLRQLSKALTDVENATFNETLVAYAQATNASETAMATKLYVVENILTNLISLSELASPRAARVQPSTATPTAPTSTKGSAASVSGTSATPAAAPVDSLVFYSLMRSLAREVDASYGLGDAQADVTAPAAAYATTATSGSVTSAGAQTGTVTSTAGASAGVVVPAATAVGHASAQALVDAWHRDAPAQISLEQGLRAVVLVAAELNTSSFLSTLVDAIKLLPGATKHNTALLGGAAWSRADSPEGGDLLSFGLVDALAANMDVAEEDVRNALLSKRLDDAVADAERTLQSLQALLQQALPDEDEDGTHAADATGETTGADEVGEDDYATTQSARALQEAETVMSFSFASADVATTGPVGTRAHAQAAAVNAAVGAATQTLATNIGAAVAQRHARLEDVFHAYAQMCESAQEGEDGVAIPAHDAVMLLNNISRDTVTEHVIERFRKKRAQALGKNVSDANSVDSLPFSVRDGNGLSSPLTSSADFVRYAFDRTQDLTQPEFSYAMALVQQRYQIVHGLLAPKTALATTLFLDLDADMRGSMPAALCRAVAKTMLNYAAASGTDTDVGTGASVYSDYSNNAVLYVDQCDEEEPLDVTVFTLYLLAKCGHLDNDAFARSVEYTRRELGVE